jgi:adenine-specific DNA-methyltransferase
LLTATPLSNSLAELWALVQYVDRAGTLLGDLSTFRERFCADDDRRLQPGQGAELQRRLQVVVRRTLRRQAQEFLRTPFVGRRTRLFEYEMSPSERELYDDVTRYLLTPGLAAFSGRHRTLLLLGFHRRMASSHRALAASLERLAERLRRHLAGGDLDPLRDFAFDLEELDEPAAEPSEAQSRGEDAEVAGELALVEGLIARLEALESDGKARALLDVMRVLDAEAARGLSRGKLVIFTESLATQDYLRELLLSTGLPDEQITLFRGQNTSARAEQALGRWLDELGDALGPSSAPSQEVAMRLALVHEFQQRSRVFISTEAGAKGLNLQFCDTLINYDLPWNPQRIEQRIGRCHRYGQTRDVTVINFLARDNAAQRLTFEILSRKLELFGAVLDASDHVLYEPNGAAQSAVFNALSGDFAGELARIYQSARSLAEIETELSRLDAELGVRRDQLEAMQARTAGLIESRLDASVRQAFRKLAEELPGHLFELDRDLEQLVCDYLDSEGVSYRRALGVEGKLLEIAPHPALPEPLRDGVRIALGGDRAALAVGDRLTLGHPLVRLAAEAARRATEQRFQVRLSAERLGTDLAALRGRRGRLRVEKLRYPGFEPVDRLLPVAVLEAGPGEPALLDAAAALRLLRGPLEAAPGLRSQVSDAEIEEALEEALFLDEQEVSSAEHRLFARAMAQLERYVEDRALLQRRERAAIIEAQQKTREQISAAPGADARARAEAQLERLQRDLEGVDEELERLAERRDEGYQRGRELAHQKRYTPPVRETILEVEFIVG